jgi:putative peptidoglycan lipid II flippase
MFARNLLTVGVGTGLSRLLGFARDIMIAATLGSGPVADAFVTAFRLPNLFRRLLSEGALNPAFVPIYERLRKEKGEDAAAAFSGDAFLAVALALSALVGVSLVAMGAVVFLLAPGFSADAEKFALTVSLSRLCFPFLLFSSLAALLAAILNARHRFVVAAFAPVALNAILVAALAFISMTGEGGAGAARTLSLFVSVGGFAQLVLCWIGVRVAGLRLPLRRPRATPELRALMLYALPGMFAGGIAQVNAFVGSIVGSGSPSAVSYLYYADRVYQLPLGVVGVAIGLVLLPDLTRSLSNDDAAAARRSQTAAIDFSLAVTAPASVALATLAFPIVDVLFRRGAFDARASVETAATLAAFAAGLPAYVLAKALQTGFFARGEMRAPVTVALAGAALDVALSLALFPALEHVGVALAASAAGWLNAALLLALLILRGHYRPDAALMRRAAMILVAAIAMGMALWTASSATRDVFAHGAGLARVGALAALCLGGLGLYAGLGHALGGFDLAQLRAALKR